MLLQVRDEAQRGSGGGGLISVVGRAMGRQWVAPHGGGQAAARNVAAGAGSGWQDHVPSSYSLWYHMNFTLLLIRINYLYRPLGAINEHPFK